MVGRLKWILKEMETVVVDWIHITQNKVSEELL
jgi:hypothetical protein